MYLTGDDDTMGVLKDARIAGADFEVAGRSDAPGHFTINPIHTRAMFVHKDGKRFACYLLVRRLRDPHLHAGHLLVLPRRYRARPPGS